VHLVEIKAYSDEDAYTIFETMNDRGLSLTPTDMLKGYLLANITDAEKRNQVSQVWKARIGALQEIGKEEDADGIKSWLRSQHAESIRERKRGAKPLDFDLIGTEYHRWVRDHEDSLGLKKSLDFALFIEHDFAFYTRQYERLRNAAQKLTEGLESVYHNAQNNFTLQYPVLLAPLRVEDSETDIARKLRISAAFLDILITRRIWNFRAIDYSTMQYAMFIIMRDVRSKSVAELVTVLRQKLADHPERHEDEFRHPSDFHEYRNRFGDLLLLPKSFNASYGDMPYSEKRPHYNSQNLLARSLCDEAYDHNPGFLRFLKESGLPFQPHHEFKKADLDSRHTLYRQLAERIWDPSRLEEEAQS